MAGDAREGFRYGVRVGFCGQGLSWDSWTAWRKSPPCVRQAQNAALLLRSRMRNGVQMRNETVDKGNGQWARKPLNSGCPLKMERVHTHQPEKQPPPTQRANEPKPTPT
mmetsp:Transcript_28225/g.54473  ORF Transcript_28225/g.54473 Transcript_28225/m.54473 type:complete len:109 (-) Transcript_28225:36-362(-)